MRKPFGYACDDVRVGGFVCVWTRRDTTTRQRRLTPRRARASDAAAATRSLACSLVDVASRSFLRPTLVETTTTTETAHIATLSTTTNGVDVDVARVVATLRRCGWAPLSSAQN